MILDLFEGLIGEIGEGVVEFVVEVLTTCGSARKSGIQTLGLNRGASGGNQGDDQAWLADQRAGVRFATSESVRRFNPGSTANR
jgi:hypothetical protein